MSPRRITARKMANFIVRKIGELRFMYRTLYVLELPLGVRSATRNDHGYQVETVSVVDDLVTLIERREAWFGEAAARRLMEGDVCCVAKLNGKVISCLFATFGNVYLPIVPGAEYNLPLDNETVGIVDAYTLPEHRGRRAYSAVFNACISHFTGTNFRRIFGFIAPDDIRSLKVHQKLGLDRIILLITSVRFLGVTKHFVKSTDRLIEEVL